MTRKQKRMAWIAAGLAVLGAAVGMVLVALNDKILFFYSPSKIAEEKIAPGKRFRMGGLVVDGSFKRGAGTVVEFGVTDLAETISVRFDGILPDLFREGQTVVAEGMLGADGTFVADTVLAKHDENYMPPEVAASLKGKGLWKDGAAKASADYVKRHNELTGEVTGELTGGEVTGGGVPASGTTTQ